MDNVAISSDNDATAEERGAGQGVGDAPQTFDIDASRSQPYDLQAYLFGKQCSSEVERTKMKMSSSIRRTKMNVRTFSAASGLPSWQVREGNAAHTVTLTCRGRLG